MLVSSLIYFLLAIYIERINPGEFGVAQQWNYFFRKSYWKPEALAPLTDSKQISSKSAWIDSNQMNVTSKEPLLSISHLTKVYPLFFYSLLFNFKCIYSEIWKISCCL